MSVRLMSNDFTENIGKAVKDFLAEAEEIIDQLSLDMVGLSDCAESGECNPDLVNSIFRGAHSLKGLAGMFGFTEIADLGHNLENLLDLLRLGKVSLDQGTVTVLFDSMDLLGNLVRGVEAGVSDPDAVAHAIVRIDSCIAAVRNQDVSSPLARLGIPEKVLNTLTEYEEHRLLENARKGRKIYSIRASFNLATFDQDLGELTDILKKEGEVISTLPSSGGGLGLSIDFEILYGTDKSTTEVTTMVEGENVAVTRLDAAAEVAAPDMAEDAAAGGEDTSLTAKSFSRTVRVDIAKLDELMNIVGELVLCHSTISELTLRMKRDGFTSLALELSKAAKGLDRKLNELQKGVMEIRMIPVGQLFDKMSRIVRKISRDQGKRSR